MIHFKNIRIEGFGSIVKRIKFELDQPGLNIIRGKVGSGKTTIPSALCWVLYGKTLKDNSTVPTWEELRTEKFKGTKVSLNFDKDGHSYIITRCLDYRGNIRIGDKTAKGLNKLIVHVDGEPLTIRNKKDIQKEINRILGYSFDLFKNSVVFGQRVKRIIEESGPDKNKIFEEAFEVDFIEEAKQKVKAEKDKLTKSYTEIDSKLDNKKELKEQVEEQYKDSLTYEQDFEKNRKSTIKNLKSNIKLLKQQQASLDIRSKKTSKDNLKKWERTIEEGEQLLEKLAKYENRKKRYQDTIQQHLKELDKAKPKDKKCPTCGGVLNAQTKALLKEKRKELKSEIKTLKKSLKELKHPNIDKAKINNDIQSAKWQIAKETEDKEKRAKNIKKHNKLSNKISKKEYEIKELENTELKIKSTKHKKKLDKLDKTIGKLEKQLKAINKELQVKSWLISDPLSNNGIKAYVFDSMLDKLNDKLYEYSTLLGFEVAFGIDMESSRKSFYQAIEKDGIIIPYEDLSGGQKQLVDTTVALAIHDTVSEIRPTNLVFMDEPFESLDNDNVDIIESIVEAKAKDKSLFLITHKTSFNPLNANQISFRLNKKKQTILK